MGEVEADVVDGGAWERGYKLEKEVEQTHFGVDKGYGKRTDVGHGEQQEHEDGGVTMAVARGMAMRLARRK